MLKRLTTKFTFQEALICVITLLVFLIPYNLFAQESSLNNYSGLWTDDATWSDGTSPGTASLATDVHIYGNVVSGSDIDFISGNLFIHDTLTIYGNLTIGDTLDLTIDPTGILIVRGDFTANDTVDVWSSGQMVVSGTFSILGDNDQGSFDNDGVLYVFDASPTLKTGIGYGDFTCVNPVDSCSLYDESDLLASPLRSLYLTGSFSIGASGPSTFCLGDSVVFTVVDTATNYRWFLDDVEIAGANSFAFSAKTSGDYHSTFFIGADSLVLEKVTVTANPLPAVSVVGLAAAYCEGSSTDTLVGGPAGGFFLAGPGLTILGAGDSAIFDPALAGAYDALYYFTDGLGCTDTATVSTVVNSLPAVSVVGLAAAYCEGSSTDTLVGGPAGGFFLAGPGLTILGAGDSAIFDPALAGAYDALYYFTDGLGCTDTATVSTVVNSLPAVSVVGLAAAYCEGSSTDTLVGGPAGGFFLAGPGLTILGAGDSAIFDPALAGAYDALYYFTDGLGCTDTATVSTVVNSLPAVSVSGLAPAYCEGSSTDTLVGGPAGGFFLAGPGLTILGAGDSAIFDPALAGAYDALYYFTDGLGCTDTATVSTVVNPLPAVSVSGLAPAYCEGSSTDTLVGGPAGGFFLAGPGLTILATGDSAIFDPALAGAYDALYYFTDGLGCTDTATVSTVVNPLPLVVFAGLEPTYCENGAQDTLIGTQLGGVFLGNGITDNTDGTAYFDPVTVGTYDITYYYTDGNACSDTSRLATTVFALPAVSFTGLDPEYCEGSDQDTLIGSQAGGVFLGTGVTDNADGTAYFDSDTPGTYDVTYYFTNGNGCSDTAVQSVTVHPLPIVDFIGLSSDLCVQDDPDTLLGNQAPLGNFFGGTVADQGNGTGIFTPLVDGVYNIYFGFTDLNGCRDSVMQSVIVHPLPVVTIGTYDTVWDVNDPAFFIAGNPVGGVFTGKGISGISYDPALAGSGLDTVVYTYTDGNSCLNSDTIIFEIRDYDFKAGARIIGDIDNYCSPDALYSTAGATPDETAASCWVTGPNNNRWFMFQAPTDQVFVQVNTGGSLGTNRNPMVALWAADGTELSCARYWDSNYNNIALNYIGLTPGEWYYISVDNYVNRQGSFTLCIDDAVDYDFLEGAKVVPHTSGWRSADAEYTTFNATPDRLQGDCWNTAVNSNRWFTFTALTPEATIEVLTGGLEGTMRYSYAALWDAGGTQIACARYTTDFGDIKMGTDGLVVGNQYYISVDHNNNNGYDGTFTLGVDDQVDYDFKAGAIELPHAGSWRSAEAEYTTINASDDGVRGSCWPNGPTYSRWFKFQATTNQVTAGMFTGGTEGTLRYGLMMLTDAVGTELACTRYYNDYSDIKLGYSTLIPGEWYYLMVDNHGGSSSYRGTFTMELDDNVNYDFREGAQVIPHAADWCSADAAYTTLNASPDRDSGSCWPNGPTFNRWFSFTATSTEAMVEMKTGGDEGTLRYGLVALWDDAGNELACGRYTSDYSDIKMGYIGLVPGNTYYISVDNHSGSINYRGTFSLCLDDEVDYDYPTGS